MNKLELKIEMARNGDTQASLADAMGIPASALNNRINGKTDFRKNEINFIRGRYHLSANRTMEIFFDEIVSESDTISA